MTKRVFITSETISSAFIKEVNKLGFELTNKSLLKFRAVPFSIQQNEFHWIFFTSKRSVNFFLEKFTGSIKNYKIACVGEATARHLAQLKIEANFIGKQAGAPYLVAENFKKIITTEKVLFPISNRSKKSISRALSAKNVVERVVYKTELKNIEFKEQFDILVFTSPSNLESFLQKNKISKKQKIIAWGTTTKNYLESQNINVNYTLEKSSFKELLIVLKQVKF